MAASRRAFVLRHTALRPVPGLPGVSLTTTAQVTTLRAAIIWSAVRVWLMVPR